MVAIADRVALELGRRLRAVREQQGLTLRAAATRSNGLLAASLLGAYERGERAVSAQRLAELAELYGVPVHALLPEPPLEIDLRDDVPRLVIDLARLEGTAPELQAVERYVNRIRRMRDDPSTRITIRHADVEMLSSLLDVDVDLLVQRMATAETD
ncbi:MAG: helix-turn-helix transcriptional regulator [Nitriliruptorales bacterium]|nr:helix-turn-helix transcriptional regulator [Nitriliruptorales bacterium]